MSMMFCDSHGHHMYVQLENKNILNSPVPFTAYMARFRTPYQQSKSTSPLYYSWNLAGELCFTSLHRLPVGFVLGAATYVPTLIWPSERQCAGVM